MTFQAALNQHASIEKIAQLLYEMESRQVEWGDLPQSWREPYRASARGAARAGSEAIKAGAIAHAARRMARKEGIDTATWRPRERDMWMHRAAAAHASLQWYLAEAETGRWGVVPD